MKHVSPSPTYTANKMDEVPIMVPHNYASHIVGFGLEGDVFTCKE
jgi:hypothetical protein